MFNLIKYASAINSCFLRNYKSNKNENMNKIQVTFSNIFPFI